MHMQRDRLVDFGSIVVRRDIESRLDPTDTITLYMPSWQWSRPMSNTGKALRVPLFDVLPNKGKE